MSIAFKLSTLAIRTLAKPISVTLKSQAKQHASFRKLCINVAQTTHRFDINMRMNLLGEKGLQHVRPLNEAKAIDSGANFISETFLFSVAGGLILFESWRSRRKETSRREGVSDAIEALQNELEELRALVMSTSQHIDGSSRPGVEPKVSTVREEANEGKACSIKTTNINYSVTEPTDKMARQVLGLKPDYGELVRSRASEVRSGIRNADL